MDADILLARHFALSEFAVSASHPELVERVPEAFVASARRLAQTVLQPLRDELRRPVRILSGYRSAMLNAAVHGSSTSQHRRAEAADVQVFGMDAVDLMRHLLQRTPLLPTGQIICYPSRKFVHLALPGATYRVPSFHVHEPDRDWIYRRVAGLSQFDALLGLGPDGALLTE